MALSLRMARYPVPLFVIAGQSNASGHALSATDLPANLQAPDSGIQIWTGAAFATLVNGTNNQGSNAGEWGPEAEFSRLHRAARPNQTIYLVKHTLDGASDGGTSALAAAVGKIDWSPDSTGEAFDAVTTLVTDARAALVSPVVSAVLWMQGETDSEDVTQANAYEADLTGFATAVRSRWGSSATKLLVGRISNSSHWAFRTAVRAAQAAVVAANPTKNALIDTDGYAMQGDLIHYSAAGQVSLGADMYAAYRALV